MPLAPHEEFDPGSCFAHGVPNLCLGPLIVAVTPISELIVATLTSHHAQRETKKKWYPTTSPMFVAYAPDCGF